MALLESTVKATEDYKPSGPPGGRSQAKSGQVCEFIDAIRPTSSARHSSSCSEGRRLQTLGRPTRYEDSKDQIQGEALTKTA